MAELLTEIRAQLQERLEKSRAALEEYERLTAALTALEALESEADAVPPRQTAAAASAPAKRPRQKRAPRNANRAKVLELVEQRPGVSTAELAAASGIPKPSLYQLVRRLTAEQLIRREELPGGRTGFRILPLGAGTAA